MLLSQQKEATRKNNLLPWMETLGITSTSLEKVYTLAEWPIWLMIIACRPNTIMFVCESSSVVDLEVYSCQQLQQQSPF